LPTCFHKKSGQDVLKPPVAELLHYYFLKDLQKAINISGG